MKLQTQDLTVKAGDRILIRGLDLSIGPGQCWALLGANGSGKTTLLHTLAGLRPPAGGRILLDGEPIATLPRRSVARCLGLMPQDNADPFPATVLETALIGRHPHLSRWQWEGPADHRRARQALAQADLASLAERWVTTLSGGERRRLAFATLLVQDPPLLLLDEPTNHLDFRHQHRLLGHLVELRNAGRAIAMSLHDVNLASRYCTHVLLLHGDGNVQHGPVSDLLTPANLARLYGLPFAVVEHATQRLFVPLPEASDTA